MIDNAASQSNWNPGRIFYAGLALVLLAMWLPFIPAWSTFIHMWRVDLAASLFLFAVLAYIPFRSRDLKLPPFISGQELWLIVIPVAAFVAWSGLSILWAPSWKSAAHHTLIWTEYLIFYLIVRYLVDQNNNFSKLLKTFTLVLVLFAIPAVIEYLALTVFGGESTFRARYAKYGEQIVTILPLLLFFVLRSTGRKLYAGLASIVLIWLLIYCTAGRINLLLFACVMVAMGSVVFTLARFRRYRTKFALAILLMAAAPVPLYLFSIAVGNAEIPIANRLNDSAGNAYSADLRLLMNSVSLEMIRSNPVVGVGADNYGLQFNAFREKYAATNPTDPNLSYGEVGIVGHAHNEFLQIAAELGIVGVAIFLWILSGIAVIAYRSLRSLNKASLFPFAAAIGLAMFLASSIVSAYSFRLMQNGLVFFFVLAIAAKLLLKEREVEAAPYAIPGFRYALAAGMAACLMLAVYSSLRVGSVIFATRANYTHDLDEASELYRLGMKLDDENPDVRNNFAMRLFQEDRFSEAVPLLEDSIRIGRAQSVDFSYLASTQSLSGDNEAAERTMASAAALYPRSAFVLTRHAALLNLNGRSDVAAGQFGRALEIDRPAANTWWTMINRGSQAATDLAFKNKDYKQVMDLQPQISMYAVLDERHVRFPEERLIFRRR